MSPNFEMAREFLAALGTHHTYQTFDDTKDRKLRSLIKIINGDTCDAIMHALSKLNAEGAGVFVTVNQTDMKGRRRANMTQGRCIFGDFDGDDAIALFEAAAAKLAPSIVVASSPTKRHAYWLCNMPIDAAEEMQAKMPEAVGCDPGAKDVTRVLRIPGYYHRKHDPVQTVLLSCDPNLMYDAYEIEAAFGLDKITSKPSKKAPTKPRAPRSAAPEYDPLDYVINERDEALLRSALKYVKSDRRDNWIAVAGALARCGPVGERIYCEWSATAGEAGGYKGDDDCIDKLREMEVNSASNFPAIFTMATGMGWRRDRPANEPVPLRVVKKAASRHLDMPPGLVGEMAEYILKSSRMPVPSFAIAGALTAASYMIRNLSMVESSDTGLNLYQVLVADTGRGKEDPRKAIKRLIKATGDTDMAKDITENLSSGAALLRALGHEHASGSLLMMSDEYGIFMQAAMQGKDEHRRDLVKELMSMYGLARSFHAGKLYADARNNIEPINFPYVVVLGTTTEEELFGGLSMTSINNGSANRNIYIYANAEVRPNRKPDTIIPPELGAKLVKTFGEWMASTVRPLGYGPGAEEMVADFGDNLPANGKFANLWSRAEENMIRVAGVLAYCDGGVITTEHVAWAIRYIETSIKHFDERSEVKITDGYFDKLLNRTLEIIGTPMRYINDRAFTPWLSQGKMPRGKLLKLLKIKSRELDEIILTLIEAKQISAGTDNEHTVYWTKESP